MADPIPFPQAPRKGRGAVTNASGRYERLKREAFDDGWNEEETAPPRIETTVTTEIARTIITRNDSPDLSFDRTINPYRGCEHGCVYCYARPNHAYVGLSPGLDFETRLFAKTNAAALLEQELAHPRYRCAPIVLGGVTDIYQPVEKSLQITRSVLEVLQRTRHPLGLVTKSQMVLRDLDILAPMAGLNLAKAAISVTTLDRALARKMEPRAAAPSARLNAIRRLSEAGVPVCVMVAPVIPGLNDHEIEAILEAAHAAGAREAGYVVLRLPLEIKDLFQQWLDAHARNSAKRVMTLVRQMRGGRDYDAEWGVRMRGEGPYAKIIAQRFQKTVLRLGLSTLRLALDTSLFRKPVRAGDQQDLL